MIAVIGNEQIACTVHRQTVGIIQRRIGGKTTIAGISNSASPGNGQNDSIGAHFADSIIIVIRNIQVACTVHRHTRRRGHISVGGRTAVAGKSRVSFAGNGGDDAIGVHLADAILP